MRYFQEVIKPPQVLEIATRLHLRSFPSFEYNGCIYNLTSVFKFASREFLLEYCNFLFFMPDITVDCNFTGTSFFGNSYASVKQ